MRKALSAYLNQEHPDKETPEAPLWIGSQGGMSHRSSVTRMLEKYAIRAGIERVNPHALRHTFATRYLNANPSDLRGLARLLGHTSLDDLSARMERVEAADVSIR